MIQTEIQKLNRNPVFKFISSVRLAVPLMLILLVVVAYGTVIESRYNTEYAGLVIYKSWPFLVLLVGLWLNIFFATISRIPFKKHHLGFVITHIGLLTLLAGGFVTGTWGIDGQLSIPEGQTNSLIVLSDLEILFQRDTSPTPQRLSFNKTLGERDQDSFLRLNEDVAGLFQIKNYIPFAKVDRVYETDPSADPSAVALSFILKSQFFNVSEWMHTQENPEMQLGPAKISFTVVDDFLPSRLGNSRKLRAPNSTAKAQGLLIKDLDSENEQLISLSPGKKIYTYKDYKIEVIRILKNAIVQENKMVEGPGDISNPSLELKISKGSTEVREILYAKFTNFSIIKDPKIRIRFTFVPSEKESLAQSEANDEPMSPSLPVGHPTIAGDSNTSISNPDGNTIQFVSSFKDPSKIQVNLMKNGKLVMSQLLSEGQNLQTPWMGMQIFIGTLVARAKSKNIVQKINPEKRNQLPGSAVQIVSKDQKEFWLSEGQQANIALNGQNYFFYYGRQTLELPMKLTLKSFKKVDYPGTDTPMSFESLVDVDSEVRDYKISMNEPLKHNGFTIYQSSYQLEPGKPPISVFSVNRDPGRFIKYLGSIILSLGIIIFTFMRSSIYRRWQGSHI